MNNTLLGSIVALGIWLWWVPVSMAQEQGNEHSDTAPITCNTIYHQTTSFGNRIRATLRFCVREKTATQEWMIQQDINVTWNNTSLSGEAFKQCLFDKVVSSIDKIIWVSRKAVGPRVDTYFSEKLPEIIESCTTTDI